MEIIVIIICLIINAIFAAVEFAFVTASRSQLRNLHKNNTKHAHTALMLRENPERTLSVLQIGITTVGAVAAAVGGVGAEEYIAPLLQQNLGIGEALAEFLSVCIVVMPLTYFSVVLGELLPKALALRNPIWVLLKSAKWLSLLDKVISPIVTVLEYSVKVILHLLGRSITNKETNELYREELEIGQVSHPARQYIVNIINVEKKAIKDIMLPWKSVISVNFTDSLEQVEDIIISSGHTRIPVVKDGKAIGLINTKEFMSFKRSGRPDWPSIIRSLITLTSNDSLMKALRLMQDGRSHMSIVYENHTLIGIVTMEDIFEEIIGDIYDEDDDGTIKKMLSAQVYPKKIRKF